MQPLKDLFLLDPKIVFLNHGSFGATPQLVFAEYQAWQRRLECQPVLFLGREIPDLMRESRQALGEFLNAGTDELVYVPNATHGVNIVARSLRLEPGDEILTTDHEYGACNNVWEFLCGRSEAYYRRQPVPLPVKSQAEIVEQIWAGVTGRTRLIYLSHISSPTALRFPVEEICRRAREAGILTLIDGAHAPRQIPLDLSALGADFYTGNCHKWLMAPKGAGFLYARRERQDMIEPLVVSWGWSDPWTPSEAGRLVDFVEWTGTHDPAAALSVPAAIRFQQAHNWEEVRKACHRLLTQALERIGELTRLEPAYTLGSDFYLQMAIAPLPEETDLEALKARLYDEYRVEVPVIEWGERKFVRISVQGYNTQEDIDTLIAGLHDLVGSPASR